MADNNEKKPRLNPATDEEFLRAGSLLPDEHVLPDDLADRLGLQVEGWDNIEDKPDEYPPEDHAHDDRYRTKAEDNRIFGRIYWLTASVLELTASGSNAATTWADLDLTGNVPNGTRAVILQIRVKDGTAGRYVQVRRNGDTPTWVPTVVAQVAAIWNEGNVICGVDRGLILEWHASHANLTEIRIRLLGYFK